MEATLTQQEVKKLSQIWKGPDLEPPADKIIDAYQTGKKAGLEKYVEKLREKRYANLLTALKVSLETLQKLKKELKVNVPSAYLRQMVTDDGCFHKTLFVTDEDTYLSDLSKEAYKTLISESTKLRKSMQLNIDFTLMPDKKLNNDLLIGDGYFYRYDEKKTSRT